MTGNSGQIQVIFGPMFSGKSTELMRRIRRLSLAQSKCLVVKYSKDTRYHDTLVCTHDQSTMSAVSVTHLSQVSHLLQDFSVIGWFFPGILSTSMTHPVCFQALMKANFLATLCSFAKVLLIRAKL